MAAETLLALWNDTPTRRAIVDFVQAVSTEGSPGFVAPAERVAVFDNDGTLWSEKPVPIQLDFTLFRMAEQAGQDPSLAERQPYRAAVERDFRWLDEAIVKHYHGDDADLGLLLGAVESAFEGMEVEAFGSEVMEWLTTASHPVLHRPYLACGFAPMVELLRYLEANGFSTYIASGGDRDFMRPFAHRIYGIPPERVIGSALGLERYTVHIGPVITGRSAVPGRPGHMLRPLIASPINLAPMIRNRTAMMTVLCWAIQSRSPASIRRDRSPSAKNITTGAATPRVATTAKTTYAMAWSAAPIPVCAISAAAPIASRVFFGLAPVRTAPAPAAFPGLKRSIEPIHFGASTSCPGRGRPRH
jgi:phosphoglycolate phosphatase-like HAD superfamily hydrolase